MCVFITDKQLLLLRTATTFVATATSALPDVIILRFFLFVYYAPVDDRHAFVSFFFWCISEC